MFDKSLSVQRAYTVFLDFFQSSYMSYTDEFQKKVLTHTVSQQYTHIKKYKYILFMKHTINLHSNAIKYKL